MTLEEALAENVKLKEENAKLTTVNENLTKSDTEQKDRISKLQEINQQYYLKITQEPPTEKEKEKEDPTETLESLGSKIYKGI